MPEWSSFLLVEAVAFLFAGAVAYEAYKEGAANLTTLLVSMAFGLAIEVYFVTQYAGYSYGDFLFEVPGFGHHVPLWVAAGWGTIIYISMQASDRMPLPWFLRPAMDGLLAVSLDVTLDPVADGLGWWNWSREAQFFGVPYDNFVGWVLIVSSYSLFVRSGFELLRKQGLWKDIVVPIVALIPAVLAVAGVQIALDKVFYPWLGEPVSFFALVVLLGSLLAIALPRQEWRTMPPLPWFLWVVPSAYHLLMVVLLFATGLGTTHPELFLFMLVAPLVSLLLYTYPRN